MTAYLATRTFRLDPEDFTFMRGEIYEVDLNVNPRLPGCVEEGVLDPLPNFKGQALKGPGKGLTLWEHLMGDD